MDELTEKIVYEIRIGGHLDSRRARRFGDMALTLLPEGVTLLSGPVPDQAALYGLLSRIRDLGLPLLSVQRRNADEVNSKVEGGAKRPSSPSHEEDNG